MRFWSLRAAWELRGARCRDSFAASNERLLLWILLPARLTWALVRALLVGMRLHLGVLYQQS